MSRRWKNDPTRKRDGYGKAPDRTVATAGRGRPAPWSPRQRSRGRGREKGAVSRSEHSGARVTATAEEGRHACVAPTRENGRPGPPVSDEGGVRRLSGAPMSRRAERPRGLAVATPTAGSPRSGASERSEVAPGAGNDKEAGGPRQSARSVCLPTARRSASCLHGRAKRPRIFAVAKPAASPRVPAV